MGTAAAFPAAAGGRSDRRVRCREAAGKPSPRDHRPVLRPARLHRLLRKLRPGRRDGAAARISYRHRRDHFEYGGTLERFAGDGVMVIFNDPVPVDNPALQAVRMALDMRKALAVLIERWRRLGHDLGFGIGIAARLRDARHDRFRGPLRLCGDRHGVERRVAACATRRKPGQILISPRVLLAVEDAVTSSPSAISRSRASAARWRRTMWLERSEFANRAS